MPSLGNFLHTQLILKIPEPTTSFASKTVIITGANSGLGKEAAKHTISLGTGKVILGCRNASGGKKVKLEIESSLRCSPIIEVWQVDIESPPSIKEFVDQANKLPRLDVLINNAGIQSLKFQVAYGTERLVAVNVIGTLLLALQLIPKLKETAKTCGVAPHMTFLESALYDVAKYPQQGREDLFAWLRDETHVNMMDQYNLSKLLLLYAVVKLASIIDPMTNDTPRDPHRIIITYLDPCFCKTGLAGDFTGGLKAVYKIFELISARSVEEGSRLVVTAASAGRQSHGIYMRAGALQEYAPCITSEDGVEKSNRVWEKLVGKLEQLQPGVMAKVNTV